LRVTVRAPAKLNLFLHIGEQHADGFHDLESLAAFTEEADLLEFAPSDELTLRAQGPFAGALPGVPDNLVMRAARALDGNRGAEMALCKNLPVAAGLGGGSADAAAALRGLNVLWKLDRTDAELLAIAASIGSDVPACLLSRPLWMAGRGEQVAALPELPPVALVLVNPGVAVPTSRVFAALNARSGTGRMAPPAAGMKTVWDLVSYIADTDNDLEAPAEAIYPVIGEVLAALEHEPGCIQAQMSGSGATCFGIFQDGPWAGGAAGRIAADHPGWWVRATRLAAPGFGAPLVLAA